MAQHKADGASEEEINIISGINKHARECPFGRINCSKPEIMKTMADTNKFSLQKKLLTRKILEIKNIIQ